MRWRLILEEYGPELRYIRGKSNIVADALSQLEMIATHPHTQEEVANLFTKLLTDSGRKLFHFPLAYKHIADCQKCDQPLCRLLREYPDKYKEITYHSGEKEYTLITKDQDCSP